MRVSQHLSGAGALLDATQAVSNLRALLLYLLTMVATVLLMGVMMLTGNGFMAGLGLLSGVAVSFYGMNAVGIMLMDTARGGASRPIAAACLASLGRSHRLILMALMTGAGLVALVIGVALVLLICKIPLLGPLLYTFAFPLCTLVMGLALMVIGVVVYPLSAASIWDDHPVMETWKILLAIARQRLVPVVVQEILLFMLFGLVWCIVLMVLGSGMSIVSGLSASILGTSGDLGHSGLGLLGHLSEMGMASEGSSGHFLAGAIGGLLLIAIGMSLPTLIMMQGLCQIFLSSAQDLDTEENWAPARQLFERMREAAPVHPAPPAASAEDAPTPCKHCGQPLEAADDKFCSHCGKPQQD